MRRIVSAILVLLMLLGVYTTSFAAGKQESAVIEIIDSMSKKKLQLKKVNLLVGGKDVITDVPGVLYNDRTLVPIRSIVESIGAQIDWNQETREAKIITDSKTIILKIDSSIAAVNGIKKELPDGVPAKLFRYQESDRTMVPLRFVSEELGMDVNWIGETMTAVVDYPQQNITAIDYDKTGPVPQIRIKTSGPAEIVPMYLPGSKYGGQDRLVLDIPNAVLNIEDSSFVQYEGYIKKNINSNGITSIRGSLFQTTPRKISRIVVDLEYQKGYNLQVDKETNEIKVEFLNSVRNVKVDKVNDVDVVVIQTEEPPVYNIMDLGNRVVVDVLNANLKFDKNEIPVSKGGINRVRTAVFSPDDNYSPDDKIVRVVLDLEQGQDAENLFVEHEENDIYIYVNDKPLKGFDYQKISPNQSIMQLLLLEAGKYHLDYDEANRLINLKILKNKMDLSAAELNIADNLVEAIKIDDITDDNYYNIDIIMTKDTTYNIEPQKGSTDYIDLRFTNGQFTEEELLKYKGKIVVLDAGHGGKDPGAISTNLKLKEKDLALDTVLRLNKLLEEAGFTTYLVRDSDTYVELYERAGVANELKADAYVSVHYNSHPDKNVSGVQVLYNADPNRDNKNFAKIMQEEMIKELKAVDRQIVERPNLVVIRETKMPAVLTEMAFLTNEKEEALVQTEEYRQKCVQALYNGITRYFDEVILKK